MSKSMLDKRVLNYDLYEGDVPHYDVQGNVKQVQKWEQDDKTRELLTYAKQIVHDYFEIELERQVAEWVVRIDDTIRRIRDEGLARPPKESKKFQLEYAHQFGHYLTHYVLEHIRESGMTENSELISEMCLTYFNGPYVQDKLKEREGRITELQELTRRKLDEKKEVLNLLREAKLEGRSKGSSVLRK